MHHVSVVAVADHTLGIYVDGHSLKFLNYLHRIDGRMGSASSRRYDSQMVFDGHAFSLSSGCFSRKSRNGFSSHTVLQLSSTASNGFTSSRSLSNSSRY